MYVYIISYCESDSKVMIASTERIFNRQAIALTFSFQMSMNAPVFHAYTEVLATTELAATHAYVFLDTQALNAKLVCRLCETNNY